MSDHEDEQPQIGWPPIDLNEIGGIPKPKPPSRAIGFFGGMLPSIIAILLTWALGLDWLGVTAGIVGIAGVADTYYRQRNIFPHWTQALACGYFVGQIIFLLFLFIFYRP